MENNLEIKLNADDLPSPPGVALKLLEIFDDPETTTEQFADVIGADPALTAKIIDYCNSPIIGRTKKTTSLHQAVVLLGLRAVKMIALSFSLIQTKARDGEESGFDYGVFWNRSLATALVAKKLFEQKSGHGDDAFLLGLMLNIGQIALAHTHLDEYLPLIEASHDQDSKPQNIAIVDLEREKWSTDHYELGGNLLTQWNFPSSISEFVEKYGHALADPDELVKTLSMSEQLARMLFDENYSVTDVVRLQAEAMELLQIDEPQFEELFENTMAEWGEYAKLLNLAAVEVQCLTELEIRARKSISKMSLGLHNENRMIQEENNELKSKVLVDGLTGLKNRHAYDTEVDAELHRSKRNGTASCLTVIDIDFFKSINDTYGHAGGDAVLVAVANCLRSSLRPYDTVYRFGGEEFVVLLGDAQLSEAEAIVERMRKAVEDMTVRYQEQDIKVTISIGAACVSPSSPCRLEKLFELADGLLYKAKSEGRNCCRVSSTENVPLPPSMFNAPSARDANRHSV